MTKPQSELEKKLDLPSIDQIGFVVNDLNQAMKDYAPLFGPWETMDADIEDAYFRGELKNCNIKMAFGHSGDLEIELIEVLSGTSPHTEFLENGRSGMHHLRYRITDLEQRITDAKKIGYEVIWKKRFSADMAFCYLEKPNDPLLIEFLEMA